MKIVACYIRVSTIENDQAKQRREINQWLKQSRFGTKNIRWYIDKPDGESLDQPRLEELRADTEAGKIRCVVVSHLDRLSFGSRESLNLLVDWCNQSLRVVAVNQQIDIKGSDCSLVASVLQAVAEMDSQARRERTRFGLAMARSRGRMGGRPPVSAGDAKVKKAKQLQREGSLSVDEICTQLRISRSTFYRYVQM
jgi:DNA invertase Pin-like site-specific DNA recombinase